MWIVKGILLGVLFFVVGGISYIGIRVGIILHRAVQQLKAGTATQGAGAYDVRIWLHDPVLWGAFFIAIAVGLWIVRARMHTT